jgi:hypothetical protein
MYMRMWGTYACGYGVCNVCVDARLVFERCVGAYICICVFWVLFFLCVWMHTPCTREYQVQDTWLDCFSACLCPCLPRYLLMVANVLLMCC